jgi:hypothetical protein
MDGFKVFFGKLTKLIGNRSGWPQHDLSVSNRVPPETIADDVNCAAGSPTRDSSLGTGPELFVFRLKRKLQLDIAVALKMRH